MNKKFLLLIMAVLCAVLSLSAFAADTVYLDGTGATEGAYTDLKSAVSALPNGGTVIVSGDTTVGTASAGVTLAKVNGKVTVTSENGAVLTLARSLTLASEIEFNNITLNSTHTSNGRIICNGNKLTIGEKVVTVAASNGRFPSIIGGKASGTCTGSHVVIKSGTWFVVFGGNFAGTFNGNSTVDFSGGTIKAVLTGGNRTGNFTGNATLNISGDAVIEYNKYDEIADYMGVIGGTMGFSGATACTFTGDIVINMSGNAQSAANILGANRYSNVTTTGDITITVGDNVKLTRNIYAGGYFGNVTTVDSGICVIVKDNATVGTNRYVCAGALNASTITGYGYVEFDGNAKLTGALYAGGYDGGFTGDTEVVIKGGTITSTVSALSRGGSVSGTTKVTLSGGNVGPVKGDATVDLAADKSVTVASCDGTVTTKTVEGYVVETSASGTSTVYTSVEYIPPVTEDKIYVDGTGNTEGAYTSLADALDAYTGGTLVICGDTTVSEDITFDEKEKDLVITSEKEAILTVSADIILPKNTNGTSVTFDLPIKATGAKIFGGFRNVTFGENFTVDGNLDFYGGVDSTALTVNADAITETEYAITVKNGAFDNFTAGNYRSEYNDMLGSVAAPVSVTVEGGTFNNYFSVSGMSILANDATLTISGGRFECPVYVVGARSCVIATGVKISNTVASDRKYYAIDGDIAINISGGTFNGGFFGAYDDEVAYTQVMRGDYTVSVTGGTFANGTVFDATQVKAYAGDSKKASITYADTYDFSVERFDSVNGEEITYDEPLRMAFIGDSITEGYAPASEGVDRLYESYPAVLADLISNSREVIASNYGISAAGILKATSYYYPDYLAYNLLTEETDADYIVVALGTNDSFAGGTTGAQIEFETNYTDLLETLGALPETDKVYVTNALVRDNEGLGQMRVSAVVRPTQEKIAKVFANASDKFVFVDLYGLTLADAKAGNLMSSDKLHPSKVGLAKMAEVLYGVIFEGDAATVDTYKRNDIYVSANGTPYGVGTKDDPTSRLDIAFAMLKDGEEATIHIEGTVAYSVSIFIPVTPSKLTIVGEGSDATLQNGSTSFKIGCDVKFDNIILATTASTEIYGCYNDIEMTDSVKLSGDWSFFAGHNIYAEGATNAAHDTVESASDAKDCNIVLNCSGSFKNFAFGNRRCAGRAPFGTYSGKLTAYIGENVAITGTDYVGIVGQNYLSGTVIAEMPETLTLSEYAPTATVTSPIVYDASNNTGTVTVKTYEVEVEEAPTTVYVDGTGKTDGAFTSFTEAYAALSDEGGTIVIAGDTALGTSTAGVTLAAKNGKVTIKGENGATLTFARSLRVSSDIEIDDLHIHSTILASLAGRNNIIMQGHTLTIGDGVTMTKDESALWPAIVGGQDASTTYDTHVVIKAGTWQDIWGGGYSGTFAGKSNVEISNATVIGTLTAGSRSGTFSGSGTLTLDLRNSKTVTAATFGADPVLLVDEGYEGALVGNTYLQRLPVDMTPKTVYLDGTGNTDGAYTTFAEALANMPGGGTIVVSGDINVNSEVAIATGGKILITSVYDGKDYTDIAAIKVANNIELGCDVTFKDIVLEKAATGDDYIFANGHNLTIDEGVYCRNVLATRYITIVGGAKSGTLEADSNVTVKSGYFRNIFGGNYNGTFKGTSTINFLGGYVDNMVAGGTFMGNFEGTSTVNIGGDAVVVYSASGSGVQGGNCGSGNDPYTFKGEIHLNLYGSARVNQNVYGTSRWPNVTTTANVYITVNDDAFVYQNLYAGGYAGTLNGNTSVIMNGGWVGVNLSAGSRGGTVNGDTYLEINGGQINYYATNLHSSYSDVAGEYSVLGGGLTGNVTGNTTVNINGGDIYGNVYGGAKSTGTVGGNSTVTVTGGSVMCGIYADGATAGSVAGTKTLNIDLSKGGTFAVGLSMSVNNLIGGGKLILFPEATVTANTFSGNVELEINGAPQARNYISAEGADGASVSYTAQGSEKFVSDGGKFGISSEGYYAKTKVVYKHLDGVEIYPRAGLATDTSRIAADEKTETSTVFYLTPGLYNVVIYHTQEDYKRTYLYVKGDKEEMVLDYTSYTPATFAGFEALHFLENTLEIYNTYYRTDNLVGYETPDSPFFNNNREGTRRFTSNDEMNAFISEKVASCDYAYAFDLFTTVGGTTVPVVIFTKDDIPAGATLEDVANTVTATKGRDIMMVVAQAHGNEPSGGEGALAMISELCGEYGDELLTGNVGAVIIVPRLNPDGSEAFTRVNSNGVTVDSGKKIDNLNRDYAMLSGPEVSGTVYVFDLFAPTVFIDCHEAPLDPQWGDSYTLTDIYDVGIMSSGSLNNPHVDVSSVIKGNYEDRSVRNIDIITDVLGDIETVGLRPYYYQTPSAAPCNHTPFGVINGAYSFLIEVPGISGGDAVFERRVFSQVTALKSIFNYAKNSNGEMAREVNEARENTAHSAQKFDLDTPIVLQHSYTRHDSATFIWNNPLVAADATMVRAENNTKYYVQDIAMKYRARPTAYVLSADATGIDKVLATLDRQGIDYYELEVGVTLTLKQYSGNASTATLGNAADVTFANGAYIIPVDGYRAYFISVLFEPECHDSGEEIATFVQAGYIAATDIYRSEESYIAAKLGLEGTYAEVAVGDKVVANAVVDGVTFNDVDTESGNTYVVKATDTLVLNFTDGTSKTYYYSNILGDTDGDKNVTMIDAMNILSAIVNKTSVENADMNNDGVVNLLDVIRVFKVLVK